jgi:hypothetical protein
MRSLVFIVAVCGALWWTDVHFFGGEYLESLQRKGVELNSMAHREIDRIVRSVSP